MHDHGDFVDDDEDYEVDGYAERFEQYTLGLFYPIRIGDVLEDNYHMGLTMPTCHIPNIIPTLEKTPKGMKLSPSYSRGYSQIPFAFESPKATWGWKTEDMYAPEPRTFHG